MASKQQFFIRSAQIKRNAQQLIETLPLPEVKDGKELTKPYVVEVKPMTRTLEQNAKLHAMLTDISQQCEFQGKARDVETWKMIMVSAHKVATEGQAEMAIGLEGEVINLRESTAQMSVKRLASLIEYVTAYGVANGVHFRDKWGFWGDKKPLK